jgi:hypothetical protein
MSFLRLSSADEPSRGEISCGQVVSAHLEHREHAIGDGVSPGRIAGAQQDREEADRLLLHRAGVKQRENAADDDNTVHKVGARHQRRMQNCRHTPDDHPAAERRQHKDIQGDEARNGYLEFHFDLSLWLMPLSQRVWML